MYMDTARVVRFDAHDRRKVRELVDTADRFDGQPILNAIVTELPRVLLVSTGFFVTW
jgi:hypothetical protein